MNRHENWDTEHLEKFLLDRAHMPFEWGINDCALFAADSIEAITGVDIASDFRGKYQDEATAMKSIQDITGVENGTVEDAAEYCAKKNGLQELKHPLTAWRGDLVVVIDAGRVISGIVHLNGRHVVAVGEKGLKRLPITAIKRAWRV